jgi:hypothetical protein
MMRFAGSVGSIAKKILPTSFSYGPAAPNDSPPATAPRELTSTLTTSDEAGRTVETVNATTQASRTAAFIAFLCICTSDHRVPGVRSTREHRAIVAGSRGGPEDA